MPAAKQGIFDADSDIAALVYRPGDAPDALLASFASKILARGFDVTGLLQGQRPGASRMAEFRIFPIGKTIVPGRPDAGDPTATRPVVPILEQAAAVLMRAVERCPSLLVLNRFGSAEVLGGGLLGVVAKAVRYDVPILTAVPEPLFHEWLAFTSGLAVKLDCSRGSLERWWDTLADPSRRTRRAPDFCRHCP